MAAVSAIALTYVIIAVPFVVSGVTICLVLTRYSSRSVSRLYAADLAGAALGCVLLISVLNWSDGPTAVLWVGMLASLGAVAFAIDAGSRSSDAWPSHVALLLIVAAAGHTSLVRRGRGIVRLVYSKGIAETPPLYEKWNSYSRVRVTGDPEREGPAQGWGLSPKVPPSRLRQLHLDIDAWAGTVMTHFDGDLRTVEHLKYDVTNIALLSAARARRARDRRRRRPRRALGAGLRRTLRHRRGNQQGHHRDRQWPLWRIHRSSGPASRGAVRQRRSAQLCRAVDGSVRHDPDLAHRYLGGNRRRRFRARRELALHGRSVDDIPAPSLRRWNADGLALVFSGTTGRDVPNDVDCGRGADGHWRHRSAPPYRDCAEHESGQRVAARHTRRCWHHPGQPASLHGR